MQKQIASATSKSGMCVRQPFLKKNNGAATAAKGTELGCLSFAF
jgi:hypothetical protein